jgi:hypothetical protein
MNGDKPKFISSMYSVSMLTVVAKRPGHLDWTWMETNVINSGADALIKGIDNRCKQWQQQANGWVDGMWLAHSLM